MNTITQKIQYEVYEANYETRTYYMKKVDKKVIVLIDKTDYIKNNQQIFPSKQLHRERERERVREREKEKSY